MALVLKGNKRQEVTKETWFNVSFTLYLKCYMPPAYMKVAHSEFFSLLEQRARRKHTSVNRVQRWRSPKRGACRYW